MLLTRKEVSEIVFAELGWRPGGSTLYRLMESLPGVVGGRRADGLRGGWLRVPESALRAWLVAQREGGSGGGGER